MNNSNNSLALSTTSYLSPHESHNNLTSSGPEEEDYTQPKVEFSIWLDQIKKIGTVVNYRINSQQNILQALKANNLDINNFLHNQMIPWCCKIEEQIPFLQENLFSLSRNVPSYLYQILARVKDNEKLIASLQHCMQTQFSNTLTNIENNMEKQLEQKILEKLSDNQFMANFNNLSSHQNAATHLHLLSNDELSEQKRLMASLHRNPNQIGYQIVNTISNPIPDKTEMNIKHIAIIYNFS